MINILVVEDDIQLNKLVCTYLNDSGFNAKGCLNARDAYDEMYNSLYQLIISDIMMPEIDGFEFAQTVRKLNKQIPILFMSAKDDLRSKEMGFKLGIDDYMVKPIELAELLLRVRALLRRANIETDIGQQPKRRIMSSMEQGRANFIGYMDCYGCFGWILDENAPSQGKIKMKRDKKIINRAELTRLQQNFEACAKEIETLEKSKKTNAKAWSVGLGLLGTAFMAVATFSVTGSPPKIMPCIVFGSLGFAGWILPLYLCKLLLNKAQKRISPLIDNKYEEIYRICEKGKSLI